MIYVVEFAAIFVTVVSLTLAVGAVVALLLEWKADR